MKTLVLYYSLTGATRAEAEKLAGDNAVLREIVEMRRRSVLAAVIPGCPQAHRRKKSRILPLGVNWDEFDKVIIGAPIWWGFPAPAFNAAVDLLPPGKEVEVFLCSSSGDTMKSEFGTRRMIAEKGCRLTSYRNVRTGAV